MGKGKFFTSWPLWLELTFVLAMCLAIAMVVGKSRQIWLHLKEERSRRAELARRRERDSSSGSSTLPEKTEIPFGPRAIEAGIEVEGIVIVRNPQLPPKEEQIGHYVKRIIPEERPLSAHMADLYRQGKRALSTWTSSPSNSRPNSAPEPDLEHGLRETEIRSSDEASSRRTYVPKRGSHLRPDDAQYDSNTLNKLEGKAGKRNVLVRQPRRASRIPMAGQNPSSTSLADHADNERSSGSSHSTDRTFGQNAPGNPNAPFTPLPAIPRQSGGYFALPTMSAADANPFTTPQQTPAPSEISSRYPKSSMVDMSGANQESQLPLLHSNTAGSPERPSANRESSFQYANSATRHVNTGFSVLPAGTFATESRETEMPASRPSESTRLSVSPQATPEPRKHRKLQKKGRLSISESRGSMERN